jgi:hypothetical protein
MLPERVRGTPPALCIQNRSQDSLSLPTSRPELGNYLAKMHDMGMQPDSIRFRYILEREFSQRATDALAPIIQIGMARARVQDDAESVLNVQRFRIQPPILADDYEQSVGEFVIADDSGSRSQAKKMRDQGLRVVNLGKMIVRAGNRFCCQVALGGYERNIVDEDQKD